MIELSGDNELVDLYVRNKLADDEEADFELRMLKNPQLQLKLQTALAIKAALELDEKPAELSSETHTVAEHERKKTWAPLALAASVLLAAVSTVMVVRSNFETSHLKDQIADMSRPQTSILPVSVNIMRTSEYSSSLVTVQKPSADSMIRLDIELAGQSRLQPMLQLALLSGSKEPIIRWQDSPSENGQTTVYLRSEQVPNGRVELVISGPDGKVLDRRLLEFIPPRG